MKIVSKKIKDLRPAEYNPRQMSKEQYRQIKDSLLKFGFATPIIINKNKERKNVIVGGHQRFRIARDIGMESVPCVEVDLNIEEEQELNIRLNKNNAEFDYDILANFFDKDFLLNIGFDEKELGIYLDEFEEQFNALDNNDAEMPIVQKFNENYDCVIIMSDNEIDTTYMQEQLGLKKSQGYKNGQMGKAMIMNVEQLRNILKR